MVYAAIIVIIFMLKKHQSQTPPFATIKVLTGKNECVTSCLILLDIIQILVVLVLLFWKIVK